jgi:ABC-type glycerol-3-phosphate transport system substrate-binding protein
MCFKKLMSLGLAMVMVVSLSACSAKPAVQTETAAAAPAPAEKVKIRFINGFTGGDGGYMKKITEGFNASQDKVFVEELQEKDHYTKFKSDNFDMVIMHASNLSTYVKDGLLLDMGEVYSKAGLSIGDFHAAGEKLVVRDGKKYGIPLDIHPLTMFYNKKLVSTVPANTADLIKLNGELQAQDKNLFVSGIPAAGLVEFFAFTIAAQNDINLVKDGYLKFDQPEYAKALMTYHDMIWKDRISPEGLGLDGEFQAFMKESKDNAAVQTAVAFTGPWFYGAAKERYGADLGVGEVPVLGKHKAVYGNAHLISVSSKVTDTKKIEAIAAYLDYMYRPENLINWADAGQSPLHKATIAVVQQNKDKYGLAFVNQKQFDVFAAPPDVYLFGEQVRYMNETVFNKLVSTKDLTEADLMAELTIATELAKQISGTK